MRIKPDIVHSASARIQDKLAKAPPRRFTRPTIAPTKARLDAIESYVNEARFAVDVSAFERAIGESDLLQINYFWTGLRAARAVGRIMIPAFAGEPRSVATGFLIAPNLLMTNWHVFENKSASTFDIAGKSRVQFGYEIDEFGNERRTTWFALAPAQFFLDHKALDYAVVAVDPESQEGPDALDCFGWLRLNPKLGKTEYGQYLSIIQHPRGEHKQIAIRENELLPFDEADDFLTYRSDTFRGSSGSPVCNDFWDVVALHHSGQPARDSQGRVLGHNDEPLGEDAHEEDIKWLANEGARVSRLVADIRARAAAGAPAVALKASFDGAISPPAAKMTESARQTSGAVIGEAAQAALPATQGRIIISAPADAPIKIEPLSLTAPIVAALPPPPPPSPSPGKRVFIEKLNFDLDYSNRRGYDRNFLGRDNPASMPEIHEAAQDQIALTKRGKLALHYHNFSIVTHRERRMAVLAAVNADYGAEARENSLAREDYGSDQWITDRRLVETAQIHPGFYDRWRKLDYGHLIRRDDACWGASAQDTEYANADTFHMTNCTPQHEAFNRAKYGFQGLWGRLEKLISDQARADGARPRVSIFAGPIFSRRDLVCEDEEIGEVRVPLAFWKVVVAPTRTSGIRAYGFILSQADELDRDRPFVEEFSPAGFEEEQKSLAAIEALTIVRFGDLHDADVMRSHDGDSRPLSTFEELWRG